MMSDTEGTFRITYLDRDTGKDVSLDFGAVTQINSSANKALSTIPLVSMGADRAFQLETGNTLTYTISFKRKSPDDYDNDGEDTTKWSNAHWYYAVNALADRWQMRTNGYRMTFKPSMTNPYAPQIDVNGYIKMLSRRYNNKFNEVIEGTIQFIVGTMYVLSPMESTVPDQQGYKTLILKSNISNSEDVARYAVGDVIYSANSGTTSIKLPVTPPAWSMYSTAKAIEVKSWSVGGSTMNVGTNKNISGLGNVITLTAIWGAP